MTDTWNWEGLAGQWDGFNIEATKQDHSSCNDWYKVEMHLRRGDVEYIVRVNDQASGAFNRLGEGFAVLMHYLLTGTEKRGSFYRASYDVNRNDESGEIELRASNSGVRIIDHSRAQKEE